MAARPLFAANTGFLWRRHPFAQRLRLANAAGFAAVEFHDEAQREDPRLLKELLDELGLTVLALNTAMGESFGRAAIPGLARQARADIEAAASCAAALGAVAIHVLGGKIQRSAAASAAFEASLRHALKVHPGTVLIEPIAGEAVEGYFLETAAHARRFIDAIGEPRLKMLFDCFHVQTKEGECLATFRRHVDVIGHVQIAGFPGRDEPDRGRIDYPALLASMRAAGYRGAFGCEYLPATTEEDGLGWRDAYA